MIQLKSPKNKESQRSESKKDSIKSDSVRAKSPSGGSVGRVANMSNSRVMEKSYSSRRLGISRLQPYQCDQILMPVEKPE